MGNQSDQHEAKRVAIAEELRAGLGTLAVSRMFNVSKSTVIRVKNKLQLGTLQTHVRSGCQCSVRTHFVVACAKRIISEDPTTKIGTLSKRLHVSDRKCLHFLVHNGSIFYRMC